MICQATLITIAGNAVRLRRRMDRLLAFLQLRTQRLLAQTGMEGVDRRKIEIPEVIKSPGEYKATAKLMPDITATFKVLVETEE